MIIALSGIIEANEKIGRMRVNKLFVTISNIFNTQTKDIKDAIVARLNGTEFSLLLPSYSNENAIELAKNIKELCHSAIKEAELDTEETFVSIGAYEYKNRDTISELFARSDNALAQAKFNHKNIHIQKSDCAVEVMGKEAWKLLINKAIEKDRFNFVSWNVIDTKIKNFSTMFLVFI